MKRAEANLLRRYLAGDVPLGLVYEALMLRDFTRRRRKLPADEVRRSLLLYLFEMDPPNPYARTEDGFRRLVQGALTGMFAAAKAEFWTPDWTPEAEATA